MDILGRENTKRMWRYESVAIGHGQTHSDEPIQLLQDRAQRAGAEHGAISPDLPDPEYSSRYLLELGELENIFLSDMKLLNNIKKFIKEHNK